MIKVHIQMIRGTKTEVGGTIRNRLMTPEKFKRIHYIKDM
jgi:hypothetical protein